MTFHQFLLALRGRWTIFVALLGATVVAAFLVTLVMPRTYEAITSVLVDAKDDQMLNQPLGSPRQQLGYMQTQIDIIQSQRVARRVVDDMKLADNPNVKAAFVKATGGRGDIRDWLGGALLHDLKVDSSQSSVIMLRYTANDGKFAADVANAFAKAYVDTTLKLRVEPTKEAAQWFDEQLKDLRSQLEAAQSRLAAFQREKGIIATDERVDIESARLNELSSQALQASAQSYDSASRLGQAKGKTSPESLPEVLANPMIQGLKAELLRAESKLAELSTRLGPNHPQYQQQAAEVKALRDRVNAEMGKIIGGVQSATSQSYAREQALKRDLAEQRKKVEALRDARSQSVVLQRDVDTAQKAYEAALQRYLVNKVEATARTTNVTILNPAAEPLLPLRPRMSINLAVGLFVGILLGLAAVFFLELLDRRVRSTSDLEIGVEAPLLGTLLPWHPSSILRGGEPKALPSPT
jgi:chain length determinant protein EpsF